MDTPQNNKACLRCLVYYYFYNKYFIGIELEGLLWVELLVKTKNVKLLMLRLH